MVKHNNFQSNNVRVILGVPQGDHLLPLLFLLYINNVINVYKYSKILFLADDTNLFMPINSVFEAIYSDIQIFLNGVIIMV